MKQVSLISIPRYHVISRISLAILFLLSIALPSLAVDVEPKKGTLVLPRKPQPPAPPPQAPAPSPLPRWQSPPPRPAPPVRYEARPSRRYVPRPPQPQQRVYGCTSTGPIRRIPLITLGTTINCTLDKMSALLDNKPVHIYQLRASAGERLRIKVIGDSAVGIGMYPSLEVQGSDGKQLITSVGSLNQQVAEGRLEALADGTYSILIRSVNSEVYGVGVQLGINETTKQMLVETVKKDSPAERMGVLPGDELIAINKRKAQKYSVLEAMKLTYGKPGSEVSVVLRRKDGTLAISMKRELLKPDPALEFSYSLIVESNQDSLPARNTSLNEALKQVTGIYREPPQARTRAVNIARMHVERLNGGLTRYHADACMHQHGGGSCLIQSDLSGFRFRFLGGRPGWQARKLPASKETEILVSNDGTRVLKVIYNGKPR